MLLTRSVIASFRSNLFMDRPPHKSLNSYFVGDDEKGHGGRGGLHAFLFHSSLAPLASAVSHLALRNRRIGDRRDAADRRCARRKWRSWDKEPITLSLSRTAGHTSPRKGIPVGVRSRESIRECSQKCNDLVLLQIRQAEFTGRHVEIVLDLGHRPAVDFFGCSCRAVSGSNIERIHVARVVEVDELLQALDVAVVKKLLLKVRPGRFRGGTLWRCHSHIARRRHLHLAVDTSCKFPPSHARVGPGTGTASEECSQSQVSVAEA